VLVPFSSEPLLKSEGRVGTAVATAAICCCRGLLRCQDPPVFSYLLLDRTRPCVGIDASRARRRHRTRRTNHRHLRRRRTLSAPDACSTPFRCCRPPPPSGRDCSSPSLEGVGSPRRGRRRSAARRTRTSQPRAPRSPGTRLLAPADAEEKAPHLHATQRLPNVRFFSLILRFFPRRFGLHGERRRMF
jgi:hypothetical protein